MANDELLRVSGTAGNPIQATFTADVTGTGVYFGRNRRGTCRYHIFGAVDIASADETFRVALQASATLGGAYVEFATSPTLQAAATTTLVTHAGNLASGVVNPAIAPASYGTDFAFVMPSNKDYVRAVLDVGGTTPSMAGVSVELIPSNDTTLISGSV